MKKAVIHTKSEELYAYRIASRHLTHAQQARYDSQVRAQAHKESCRKRMPVMLIVILDSARNPLGGVTLAFRNASEASFSTSWSPHVQMRGWRSNLASEIQPGPERSCANSMRLLALYVHFLGILKRNCFLQAISDVSNKHANKACEACQDHVPQMSG